MDITTAILCDSATVREGLLHLLGGPINRLWRPNLPAPLGVALAAIVEIEQSELDVPHEIRATISNDLGVLAEVAGGFQVGRPPRMETNELGYAPFVMPLQGVVTNAYGRHVLTLTVDVDVTSKEIKFWVLHPVEQDMAPVPDRFPL